MRAPTRVFRVGVALTAAVALAVTGCSSTTAESTASPLDDSWLMSPPEQQGMDADILTEMLEVIDAQPSGLDGLVIVRNGVIVEEQYYGRYDATSAHELASVTKSVMATLIGVAIHQGCIGSVDDTIGDYLDVAPAESDERRDRITIEHLLTMSSGIEWDDSAGASTGSMMQSSDWVQHVVNLPMAAEPGTVWNYSSGDVHLLSAIINFACGMSAAEYAEEYLFGPIEMSGYYIWPDDPQGVNWGSFGAYLTPRDMARIGQLYLMDGVWEGERLLPEGWVERTNTRHFHVPEPLEPWDLYFGYMWWIDGDAPVYAAHGHGGQFIWVLEEHDMVVVITRDISNPDSEFVWPQQLLRDYIIPAAAPRE